jgi:hypothetical protein
LFDSVMIRIISYRGILSLSWRLEPSDFSSDSRVKDSRVLGIIMITPRHRVHLGPDPHIILIGTRRTLFPPFPPVPINQKPNNRKKGEHHGTDGVGFDCGAVLVGGPAKSCDDADAKSATSALWYQIGTPSPFT